jgi:hypothetical protein
MSGVGRQKINGIAAESQNGQIRDYKAFTTVVAVSSCVSRPSRNASRESSIEILGTMPLFSSTRPCHVK